MAFTTQYLMIKNELGIGSFNSSNSSAFGNGLRVGTLNYFNSETCFCSDK
jgi:hypothetical protein